MVTKTVWWRCEFVDSKTVRLSQDLGNLTNFDPMWPVESCQLFLSISKLLLYITSLIVIIVWTSWNSIKSYRIRHVLFRLFQRKTDTCTWLCRRTQSTLTQIPYVEDYITSRYTNHFRSIEHEHISRLFLSFFKYMLEMILCVQLILKC